VKNKEIYVARTQGFCAGVSFAVDIVFQALERFGPPLYVFHEIVHNTYVVNQFREKGIIFVEDLNDVPVGARTIFSAHGVPPTVVQMAEDRKLRYVDASCPLVKKVHREAIKFSDQECQIILIGHKGHQELIGTTGYIPDHLLHIVEDENDVDSLELDQEKPVAFLTQTTLSVDDTSGIINKLKQKFPQLASAPRPDICYATQNRQNAIKELAGFCDLIIVCGSPNSSNSNRLRETGEKAGVECYIIDHARELDLQWLNQKCKIGLSSGASVPRVIVDEVIEKISTAHPGTRIQTFDDPEKDIVFKLPDFEKMA